VKGFVTSRSVRRISRGGKTPFLGRGDWHTRKKGKVAIFLRRGGGTVLRQGINPLTKRGGRPPFRKKKGAKDRGTTMLHQIPLLSKRDSSGRLLPRKRENAQGDGVEVVSMQRGHRPASQERCSFFLKGARTHRSGGKSGFPY